MSAADITVGYPVHAVAEYTWWVNDLTQVRITDWRASCGATGRALGIAPFGRAGSARWRELCPACWPARHATAHPEPVQSTKERLD